MTLNEFKYFIAQVDGHISFLIEIEGVEERYDVVLRVVPLDGRRNHWSAPRNGEGDCRVQILDIEVNSVLEEPEKISSVTESF